MVRRHHATTRQWGKCPRQWGNVRDSGGNVRNSEEIEYALRNLRDLDAVQRFYRENQCKGLHNVIHVPKENHTAHWRIYLIF